MIRLKHPAFEQEPDVIRCGHYIRHARQCRGLSQRGLAEKLGMQATYLCAIENGKKNPSLKLLRKIAKVLSCVVEIHFFLMEDV